MRPGHRRPPIAWRRSRRIASKCSPIDRLSGKTLWRRTAVTATPHEGYHPNYGSFASNSPATDGGRVYAFFGSRGLFCYDLDDKLLWQKDFNLRMRMRLGFAEGSAVVVDRGRLYLVFDHEGEGLVTALDGATGRQMWHVRRAETTSWSTPLVVDHAGKRQLVVTAETEVRAYDVDSGSVVWEVEGLARNPVPQPVQYGDHVVVMSGYRSPKIMAIRLGRMGVLTEKRHHVAVDTGHRVFQQSSVVSGQDLRDFGRGPAHVLQRGDRTSLLPAGPAA